MPLVSSTIMRVLLKAVLVLVGLEAARAGTTTSKFQVQVRFFVRQAGLCQETLQRCDATGHMFIIVAVGMIQGQCVVHVESIDAMNDGNEW